MKGNRDKEKIGKPRLNEHSHVQRKFNMGVSLEKDPMGEINLGLRTAFIVKKDKEFSVVGEKDENNVYTNMDMKKEEPIYADVEKNSH